MESEAAEIVLRKSPLDVCRVTKADFNRIYFGTLSKERVLVSMYDWKETDGTKIIQNVGADPCLILFAFFPNNHVISGHFVSSFPSNFVELSRLDLEFEEERVKENFQKFPFDKIAIPRTEMDRNLSDGFRLESAEKYTMMVRRIGEMVKKYGSDNVWVYLFGQHFIAHDFEGRKDLDSLHHGLLQRINANTSLLKAGVSIGRIVDCRSLVENTKARSDGTFYIPQNKAIYLFRGEY